MNYRNTILIVDDEEDMLETCRIILEPLEFEIFTTTSPQRALEYLKSKKIDVLVTDLKMPEMNGLELIERVKTLSPDTEILVFTAYASIETAVEAIKRGAFNYIQKPFPKEQFIELIKRALETKNIYTEYNRLKDSLRATVFNEIIYSSRPMENVVNLALKASASDTNVLITGESGTGKEMVAKFIHQRSKRKNEAFVVVDMNTINESIAESELFGYKKGAFTGATEDREGLIERANNGTLFLDEIGDIKRTIQSKLLRVIEEKKFRRVGSTEEKFVNLRIISATNKDIPSMIKSGEFREDLYYRLNVIHINIQPLRERKDDIPLLVDFFINGFNKIYGKNIKRASESALARLLAYSWPGNVRELKNVLERAVVLTNNDIINEEDIILEDSTTSLSSGENQQTFDRKQFLKNMDKKYLWQLVQKHNGNISAAAREAGVDRSTIYRVLKKAGS